MLVIGGWLGIGYQNERSDRFASVIFGAGSGLVGDEVGLLLTFGEYWTGITYTFIIIVSSIAGVAILLSIYSKIIRTEFDRFMAGDFGFYFGVFLATVSFAFLSEADAIITIIILSVLSVTGILIVLAHLIRSHWSPRLVTKH
jgi:hypothetical protein